MKTPVYSALGKITKAMVLFGDMVHFTQGMSSYQILSKYTEVMKDFKKIASLLKNNNAELYIFYDYKAPGKLPEKHEQENIILYAAQGKTSITHPWAQDVIHFAPLESGLYSTICYLAGITSKKEKAILPNFVYERLVKNNIIDTNYYSSGTEKFPAGNSAIGFDDGDDYMIIGSPDYCELSVAQLSDKFNIKPDRITKCKVEHQGLLIGNFYHLDLYLTIVGKTTKKIKEPGAKELILLAEAHGIEDPYNAALQTTYTNLQKEMKSVHIERLPCIILSVNKVNTLYSYNNCLVENYSLENGDRKLCFYLPDYTDPLMKDFDKIALTQHYDLLESFNNSVENAIESLGINDDFVISSLLAKDEHFKSHKTLYMSSALKEIAKNDYEKLIDKGEFEVHKLALGLQIKIEEQLKKLGATDVHFIEGDFIEKASAKCSLHCLVKVLERDLVEKE